MNEIRDRMKFIPLFVRLQDPELDAVLGVGRREEYAAGAAVVREGDTGDALFVILEGSVEIRKGVLKKEVSIMRLEKDDCFGEMSLIDIEPRSASAVAVEATAVLRFAAQDLSVVFQENPAILPLMVTNIARILSRRLRLLDERLLECAEGKGDGFINPRSRTSRDSA